MMSNLKIIYRNPGELIQAEYNPRKILDVDFEALKDSVKRFGFVDPLIVNQHPERKDILVGGHQRLKAAKALGIDSVPCVYVNLTLDKERELNVRLNKNTGEFDTELLREFFSLDELGEWGFEHDELDFFGDEGEIVDYSDKNQEIDIDDFEDEMILKLKYTSEEYEFVKAKLSQIAATPEQAVYKLLNGA